MELVVFTAPNETPGELSAINRMFELGLTRLHVRRPGCGLGEVARLVCGIEKEFRSRVVLHSHYVLGLRGEVAGIHEPVAVRESMMRRAAAMVARKFTKGTCSTSWHLGVDAAPEARFSYGFLSPIFPSISKPGYGGSGDLGKIKLFLKQAAAPIFGLGGVTADRLAEVKEFGFAGAGVLGAVWGTPDPVTAFQELHKRCLSL